jgi:predicted transcriptional regulator
MSISTVIAITTKSRATAADIRVALNRLVDLGVVTRRRGVQPEGRRMGYVWEFEGDPDYLPDLLHENLCHVPDYSAAITTGLSI